MFCDEGFEFWLDVGGLELKILEEAGLERSIEVGPWQRP